MAKAATYKLDLSSVLQAIDRQDFDYYSRLTDEEKKGYVPLVLMRYMSSLNDQNRNSGYAVIATNDLVNIGFWNLTKHPELQHKLLCLAGLGGKQYRPWIASKKSKKSGKIDAWLSELYPHLNEDEISLMKSMHDAKSWAEFVKGSGVSDSIAKDLIDAWKKQSA